MELFVISRMLKAWFNNILMSYIRLRVERAADENAEDSVTNNNSGRNLKVEALTTVRQLERFLAKSVARQWYDMDRSTFHFVQKIKSEAPLNFTYDVSIILLYFRV